jgi:uncharacterized protein (DUF488 family)
MHAVLSSLFDFHAPSAKMAVTMPFPIQRLWTVGHSTRSIDDFIAILQANQIETLVDVRHFPGSRRYPHFNKESLRQALEKIGIQYVHLVALGGRRPAKADSHNLSWRNASFRGYADYMETAPFREGIELLIEIAIKTRTAIMCSEAVWWRCQRSMIADFLKAGGWQVIHILDANKTQEHPFTSAAQLVNGQLSYRGVIGEAKGEPLSS